MRLYNWLKKSEETKKQQAEEESKEAEKRRSPEQSRRKEWERSRSKAEAARLKMKRTNGLEKHST